MSNLRIIVIFISLCLSSCYLSPRPIYILVPREDTGIWLMGKQYFHSGNDDFKIVLVYDKIFKNKYQFEVEITNLREDTVLISPQDYYIVASNEVNPGHTRCDTIYAIDPEQQILEANKKFSREQASYYSTKGTNGLFTILDLFVDIAETGKTKTKEEILEEENEDLQREVEDLQTDLEYDREIKSLNSILSKWEYEALRKTTLPRGYSIQGKLYFPAIETANQLDVHINIESKKRIFKFNQSVEKVNK